MEYRIEKAEWTERNNQGDRNKRVNQEGKSQEDSFEEKGWCQREREEFILFYNKNQGLYSCNV